MSKDCGIEADSVANVCYQAYEKNLANKNKLAKNEWTNLAAIVLVNSDLKTSIQIDIN